MPESDTRNSPSLPMALPKRSSPSPPQNSSTLELKQRVITCLNKLSDRDTFAVATTELESIARNLTHDSFSPFLTCIYSTDSSEKTPVRKQCVRLLGFLSQTHGDALSPFLSKMLSNVVRRLRDPDSAVRSACIDAVVAMASHTRPPFPVLMKPLMEALLLEQDYNAQMGSALCLASAIEASPEPEPVQLQRLLPRLVKLLKSECFKAKPALLSLIGCVVGVGGASCRNVLGNLIPCMIEFLGSEDWAARKAAAEAFVRLAIVERNLLSEFKSSCLTSFEARKFDKVKAVRDTMNRMLEAWKDVPGLSDEISPPSQSKSSSRENASDRRFTIGSGSCGAAGASGFETPQTRKNAIPTARSPSPNGSPLTDARKRSPLVSNERKSSPALFRKLDCKKPSDWKFEIAVPHAPSFTAVCKDDNKQRDGRVLELGDIESNRCSRRPETKHVLFSKNCDNKMHKLGGLRSGTRVVPFHEDSSESTVVMSNATEEIYGNGKDNEDLFLIREQLLQIENQQSSLFDLLQKFIGSSQNGIRSLETRVHGLELALDEISYDLAVSNGRMSGTDTEGITCCKLPGAEFLSSKFWRRTESRYSSSRFSSSGGTPSLTAMRNMADRDGGSEPFTLENRRFRLQGSGGFVNPLAEIGSDSRGSSESYPNRRVRNIIHDPEGGQGHSGGEPDVSSSVTGISPTDVINRSSA